MARLDHKLEMLLASLLAGKLPRNLAWSEVIELMGRLGEVLPRSGNEVEFVVGSHRAFFIRPRTHSLEVDEVSRLRRFLREAGLGSASAETTAAAEAAPAGRTVVVIDHHGARIFHHQGGQHQGGQDLGGSGGERKETEKPYDPHGFHRHLIHRKESDYAGQRVPEEDSFYEQIAEDLKAAREIILIGHGTGKSSALDFLVEYLKTHDSTIWARVVATEVRDLSALTEPEIEAIVLEARS